MADVRWMCDEACRICRAQVHILYLYLELQSTVYIRYSKIMIVDTVRYRIIYAVYDTVYCKIQ